MRKLVGGEGLETILAKNFECQYNQQGNWLRQFPSWVLNLPSISLRPDLTAGLRIHGKVVQNKGVWSGGLDLAGVVVGGSWQWD